MQGADTSTQPAPVVRHPAKAVEQAVSVVRVFARPVQTWLAQAPAVHEHALK